MSVDAQMKPFQEQTYYELLEVSTTASDDEIRAAFDRQLELYAPDSVAIYALEDPAQADELRARLREAMEILTDPDLRVEYDRTIGISPRAPRAEVLRADHEAALEPAQLAMAEVLATIQDTESTHPEFAVSYVPPEPSSRSEAPPPPPRHMEEEDEPRVVSRTARPLDVAPEIASEVAIATAEAAMAQVALKTKDRPKPLEIPPDAEFNGELLRRVRESRGWTVQQVADRTRISVRHIENIEADRYAALPAPVYLRGILVSLAKEYGLEGNRVSKSYMALSANKK